MAIGQEQSEELAAGESTESAEAPADRNGVAVHFAGGDVARYAAVVRIPGDDWLYAERLVGAGEGLDEEEFETINSDAVRRVRSSCVHRVDGVVVHHGPGLFVDAEQLLDAGWIPGQVDS